MNLKILSPKMHCTIDYAFSAIQIFVPKLLGLPKSVQRTSQVLGSSVLALNSLTESPVAVKPVIPFKTHYNIDIPTVAGLALLTFTTDIRTNKKALIFHLSFLALATLNVLLTDTKAAGVQEFSKKGKRTLGNKMKAVAK